MMRPPEGEKPTLPYTRSDSLIVNVVNEMPLRVVFAVTFVAFFFFWGAINTLVKMTGHDSASLSVNPGPIAGGLAAVLTPLAIWLIKRRGRR